MPIADRDLEQRVVGPGFHAQVYEVVLRVPRGRLTTYGDVATVLGSPRVARHVGWALNALDERVHGPVPWHRVVNGRGRVSVRGQDGRATVQSQRLAAEGVAFDDEGRIADFARLRYTYPDPGPADAAPDQETP
ncbi:MAG: MGMT family protein [Myxococcales bacterium]|nr:MGMT family protein [Myxococcales bacterium]MCB9731905.1 MGMT family protein [Deltaproteobacteria bacterium]